MENVGNGKKIKRPFMRYTGKIFGVEERGDVYREIDFGGRSKVQSFSGRHAYERPHRKMASLLSGLRVKDDANTYKPAFLALARFHIFLACVQKLYTGTRETCRCAVGVGITIEVGRRCYIKLCMPLFACSRSCAGLVSFLFCMLYCKNLCICIVGLKGFNSSCECTTTCSCKCTTRGS